MHSGPGTGADMVQTIKTYAQTKNDPNVYILAQIPPPAQGGEGGTTPPSGTPFDFTVGLLQDGSVAAATGSAATPAARSGRSTR
jgi:hypothetical protein